TVPACLLSRRFDPSVARRLLSRSVMSEPRRFALTPGEPAGIGPDLCLLLARQAQPHILVAIASHELLEQRAAQLGVPITVIAVGPSAWPSAPASAGSLYVWDTPLAAPAQAGHLDPH